MAVDKENTNSAAELRTDAEVKVAAQSVATESLNGQDVKRLYHELQVHQVELEMQNEELRQAYSTLNSERAKSEETLRVINANLQATLEATADGILAVDTDGRILFSNKRFAELWFIPQDILDTNDDSKLLQHVLDQLSSPNTFLSEVHRLYASDESSFDRIDFKDGRVIERYSFPLRQESAKISGRVWSFRDTTDRKRADEALRLSEKRLSGLNASMSEGLVIHKLIYDEFGKAVDYLITDVNPAFEILTGFTRSQAIDKKASELYGTGEAPYLDRYAKVASTGTPTSFEVFFVPMNKHFNISVFSPGKGDFATIFQDITERKRMEDELHKSNAFNQSIIDSSNDCIKVLNMDGRMQFMNLPGQRLLEINEFKPYFNVPYADFWKGSDNVRVIDVLEKAKLGQSGSFRGYCPTAGGTPKWWDVSISPILGANGKPERLLAVSRDITERRLADEELVAAKQKIQSIIDNTPAIVYAFDLEERFVLANSTLAKLLNSTPAQMIGKRRHDFMPKTDADWHEANDRKVIEAGEAQDFEEQSEISNCSITWLTTKFPLRDTMGRIYATGGISTDITERKNAEKALQNAHDELEHRVKERTIELSVMIDHLQSEIHERKLAEKKLLEETAERLQATEALREKERMLIQQSRQAAMGEMIGNIAHQWRQPLNTLGLYTQRLGFYYGQPIFNKEFLDTSVAKSMEIIQHMSKTIDDFRNYFKPDKEMIDFNVIEVVKNTLSLMEGSFQNPKIGIEIIEKDNTIINGYKNEFAQVLLNILVNARDVVIEREIADATVTITICREDHFTVVTISDNAGGISEEYINKVFDPYFTTKGPQQGTGIGLFMSKTIIEKNMRGKLSVQNIDNGAEFRIEVLNDLSC
jgi:PAS domain S-box-containing protein